MHNLPIATNVETEPLSADDWEILASFGLTFVCSLPNDKCYFRKHMLNTSNKTYWGKFVPLRLVRKLAYGHSAVHEYNFESVRETATESK